MGALALPHAHDLVKMLVDPDPEVRRLAAEALTNLGDEGAAVIAEYLDSPYPDLRKAAAEMLAGSGSGQQAVK